MTIPAVSIALPVYNGGSFLAEALKSVLEQDLQSFELIVADDGSTDGSVNVITEFANKDQRVRLHQNSSNLGLFGNYNRCMELATGKYIKPFAQDDLWDKSILSRMVRELDSKPNVSLVTCSREYVDGDGRTKSVQKPFDHDTEIGGKDASFEMLSKLDNFIGEPCAVMFRREQMGTGFDAGLPQLGDLEYWLRLLQQGNLFVLADALCKYRVHSGNQTHKNIANAHYFADLVAVKERYFQVLTERGISHEDFTARVLNKAVDVTNYAVTQAGIDYSKSDFANFAKRPKELGSLLIDALRQLHGVKAANVELQARLDYAENERNQLAQEVSTLKSSQSFKVAQALRGFKRFVGR